MGEPSRAQLADSWAVAFAAALECDSWGQVEEAAGASAEGRPLPLSAPMQAPVLTPPCLLSVAFARTCSRACTRHRGLLPATRQPGGHAAAGGGAHCIGCARGHARRRLPQLRRARARGEARGGAQAAVRDARWKVQSAASAAAVTCARVLSWAMSVSLLIAVHPSQSGAAFASADSSAADPRTSDAIRPVDEHGNLNLGLSDMKRLAPTFDKGLSAAQQDFPISLRCAVGGGDDSSGGAGTPIPVRAFGAVEGYVSTLEGPKPLTREDAEGVDVLQDLESPGTSEMRLEGEEVDDFEDDGHTQPVTIGGTLLGPPRLVISGARLLTIHIDRVGLKDAENYLDPFITVSVCDRNGQVLEGAQDTPLAVGIEARHVLFGFDVHIQTPLNEMRPSTAVFLEFKHWKPSKRKVSTRCWSMLEMDELRNGSAVLEVYKKPTEFGKRTGSYRLLSVKPLYMQLRLTVRNAP